MGNNPRSQNRDLGYPASENEQQQKRNAGILRFAQNDKHETVGGGTRSGAEDEGVGVGVGGLVGEVESEAGGVLGEGERAGADEFDALDGLG